MNTKDICETLVEMLNRRDVAEQFDQELDVLYEPWDEDDTSDLVTLQKARTFADSGALCLNAGFTLTFSDGSQYQFQCVRSR
jgi:hypothetical protein